MDQSVSFDRAGRGVLDVMEADGTKRFYNVSDFLADLRGGKFAEQAAPPAEFTHEHTPALGLPVYVAALDVYAVISGHSTCDGSRWRVTYFNRRFWRVEHKWFARSQFEVIGSAAVADNVPVSAA